MRRERVTEGLGEKLREMKTGLEKGGYGLS